MAIEFKCHNCQKTLRVADEFAGKKARCPNCQTILQVQSGSETVEPISAQPPLASAPQPPAYEQSGFPGASPLASSSSYTNPSPRYQDPTRRRSNGAPHRGGIVLGLGIAAFFCPVIMIPGLVAFFMGMGDLRAIREGRMDDEGHGLTLAGTILGGISTGIGALLIFFYALIFFVAIAAA